MGKYYYSKLCQLNKIFSENAKKLFWSRNAKFFEDHLAQHLTMWSPKSCLILISVFHVILAVAQTEERKNFKTIFDLLINIGNGFYFESNGSNPSSRLDCPLCDSSVYSYCSEKLLHDACCCLNPYEHKLPQQCKYADCGFLHANSCREHKLITACCCSKVYDKRNNK